MTMHDHATSCIAHERLRVEYGLVRKSCMNHARTCKNFFLGKSDSAGFRIRAKSPPSAISSGGAWRPKTITFTT